MTKKTKNIIIIICSAVLVLGVTAFIVRRKKTSSRHIVFMGGLDNRGGDLNIEEQTELIKKGLGEKFTIDSYRYNDKSGVLNAIDELQKSPYVVLFSAGGSKSNSIAERLKSKGFDLSKLYVVEPYTKSANTKSSVTSALSLGMPEKNLIIGKSSSTGKGVTNNATPTPSCSPSHWCSLTEVGKIIANQ